MKARNASRFPSPSILDIENSETRDVARQFILLNKMRADDDMEASYAAQYMLTSEDAGIEPNWNDFREAWEARNDGEEEMAHLLSLTLGVEYEEALAWITDY